MKLRTKILISYLLLLTTAFFFFYIVSIPLVRNYIKKNVAEGLQQETTLIKTRTNQALEDVADRDSYIKALISERITVERLGLSSSMGLMYYNKATNAFVPGNSSLQLSEESKDIILGKITTIDTTPFEITINGTNYLVSYFLPPAARSANQRIVVVVYTPLDSIKIFTYGFTRIILVVFLVVMVGAVILSIIFAEKINSPVIKLKKQALALKDRNFDARSDIHSGDEFEDLSKSMNAAAEELAGYSKTQREFLDNISHELKTPLMSIQGYAEGIKDGIFPADVQTLDIITDESIRLKKLVGEISYLSKLESMPDFYKKSKMEINEVIETSIDSISGLPNARDTKIVLLNLNKQIISGDSEKLLQLMINILSNSLRYAQKAIFIDTAMRNDKYVITIKDDGKGFEVGEEQRIFRRFYKGPGGNTGLGLSIAMAIAQNHGGNITAWNAAPHGAVIEVTLSI